MALTNGSRTVLNNYNCDVFGAVRSSTGSQANAFKFTGEQTDASRGLEYLRARYYDPSTGSFASRDPVATSNRFNYVEGDPVNFMDPSGQCLSQEAYDKFQARGRAALNKLTGGGWLTQILRETWEAALKIPSVCKAAKDAWDKTPPEVKQCAVWGIGGVFGGGVWGGIFACAAGAASQHFDPDGKNPWTQCAVWAFGGLSAKAPGAAVGCVAGVAGSKAPKKPGPQCAVWGGWTGAGAWMQGLKNARKAGVAGCGAGAISTFVVK